MRRLVIVLADGLRPDAVSPTLMPSLDALGHAYTLARRAQTVRPSATVAALASLATGVCPATHRLIEPGLGFLPRLGRIRPVAWELARASVPADIVTAALGPAALPVAWALASTAGVRRLVAKGSRARKTAAPRSACCRNRRSGCCSFISPTAIARGTRTDGCRRHTWRPPPKWTPPSGSCPSGPTTRCSS